MVAEECMKYLSVCSGIEAATVAWHPLGWTPLAFADIEPFPRALLAHHYPGVPLHGDFTVLREQEWIVDADVLVGGTPCQAFSVAGLRNSLSDDRGNLSLEFVRLANAIDDVRSAAGKPPAVIVWENVPGVLSVKDNAFGCFLAALAGEDAPLIPTGGKWTNAGVVIGPKRAIAWRVLDAQYFGLAQRRRRVFVVASARDGFDPGKVLFESEGLRRDTAPRREAREGASGGASRRAGERSHWDGDFPHPSLTQSHNTGGVGQSNQELFSQRGAYLAPAAPIWRAGDQSNAETLVDQAGTLNCNKGQQGGILFHVAHTLKGEGFDASEDGTGRGTPLVPVYSQEVADPLTAHEQKTYTHEGKNNFRTRNVMAFSAKDHGADATEDLSPTLRAMPHNHSHANGGGQMAVAVSLRGRDGGGTAKLGGDIQNALRASQGGGDKPHVLAWQPGNVTRGAGAAPSSEVFPTLKSDHGRGASDQQPHVLATGFYPTAGQDFPALEECSPSVKVGSGGTSGNPPGAQYGMAVRRLTPVECERLQGFPSVVEFPEDDMTRDEIIALALAAGHITADTGLGKAYCTRGPGGVPITPVEIGGIGKGGYVVASVRVGKVRKQVYLHRVIWIAENGMPPDGLVIDHINNDKTDNRIANLQLLTARENSYKARDDGLYHMDDHPLTKATVEVRERIFLEYQAGGISYSELAERYGLTKGRIGQIVREYGYTNIPWRGKPESPDGPRYKALGNSMAVPVMRWIGRRIAEALK